MSMGCSGDCSGAWGQFTVPVREDSSGAWGHAPGHTHRAYASGHMHRGWPFIVQLPYQKRTVCGH